MKNIIEELNLVETAKLLITWSRNYKPITDKTFTELIHSKVKLNDLLLSTIDDRSFSSRLIIIKKEDVDNYDIFRCPIEFLLDSFRDNGNSIDEIVNELFSEKYQGEQKTFRLLIAYSLFIQSCYADEILNYTNSDKNGIIEAGCFIDNTGGFEWLYIFHLVRMAEKNSKHINSKYIRENLANYFNTNNSEHLEEIHETIKIMQTNLSNFTEFIYKKAINSSEFKKLLNHFAQYLYIEKGDNSVDISMLEDTPLSTMYELCDTLFNQSDE